MTETDIGLVGGYRQRCEHEFKTYKNQKRTGERRASEDCTQREVADMEGTRAPRTHWTRVHTQHGVYIVWVGEANVVIEGTGKKNAVKTQCR